MTIPPRKEWAIAIIFSEFPPIVDATPDVLITFRDVISPME